MSSKRFLADRRRGEKGQRYVADMYRSWGLSVWEVPRGHFPGYDIEAWGDLNGKDVRFKTEVKHDYKYSETGNVALELEALSHSQAGILCIYTDKPQVFMMPLQNALSLAQNWPRKLVTGEHGEVSAIVPEKDLMERVALIQKLTIKNEKEAKEETQDLR